MQQHSHVGATLFLAERAFLLSEYDKAKAQTAEDSVPVEHGNVAEAVLRRWLNTFLPRRFAATKGYIITSNFEYSAPLEEWDIIIYDAMEAPVLFVRGPGDEKKRGIPIEHVRAVIEVKAALNPRSASQVVGKLTKLQAFVGTNTEPRYPIYLCHPFVSCAVFFETALAGRLQYQGVLDTLSELMQVSPTVSFLGSLVLRSQRVTNHCGYFKGVMSEKPMALSSLEVSAPFKYPDGTTPPEYKYGMFGCLGWCEPNFSIFMFDLLAAIRGTLTSLASSFYGLVFGSEGSNLFPQGQ